MSKDIRNLLASISGLKSDFRIDWREDSIWSWKIDWASLAALNDSDEILTDDEDLLITLE